MVLLMSFVNSKDIFSISKIYLVILFTFFGQVFLENQNPYVSLLVFLLISLSFVTFNLESNISFNKGKIDLSQKRIRKMVTRIWIISLIPVLSQLYLINSIGDFSSFISSINSRVVAWQNFGTAIMLIKLINVLNYLYFIIIIKFKPINKWDLILFLAHLFLFVGISLLAGSRSTLLWNFVFMLMFYNFFIKKVSLRLALFGGMIILFIATFIGYIRASGVKFEDNSFITQEGSSRLEFMNFSYGVEPLEKLVEESMIASPEYGMTYFTAVTNLVPRSIWPQKPSSGGVIITEKYFNNRYDGFSYYTTGVLPEAIINFGLIPGVLFGLAQMVLFIFMLTRFAKAEFKFQKSNFNLTQMAIYPFLLVGVNSYLYAEFTTNTISLFVFKILEFYVVYKIVTLKRIV